MRMREGTTGKRTYPWHPEVVTALLLRVAVIAPASQSKLIRRRRFSLNRRGGLRIVPPLKGFRCCKFTHQFLSSALLIVGLAIAGPASATCATCRAIRRAERGVGREWPDRPVFPVEFDHF